MIIIGLDPGTTRIGYGILEKEGGFKLLESGILKITEKENHGRLVEAADHLSKLFKKYNPGLLAIEKIFFMKNQKTAMAVAEVRGALVLKAKAAGIQIKEYAPTEVKKAITGSGIADKKAVLKMVKLSLSLQNIPGPDDVSDAVAIALTAGYDFDNRPFAQLLS